MTIHDLDTTILVDWIKATKMSVFSEKGNCLSDPINVKWNKLDKVADMFCMQARWDWLFDDWAIHPLNVLITQVMVNIVIKGVPFTWHPI